MYIIFYLFHLSRFNKFKYFKVIIHVWIVYMKTFWFIISLVNFHNVPEWVKQLLYYTWNLDSKQ